MLTKEKLKNQSIVALFILGLFTVSCGEPCDDVICDPGFTCVEGDCIEDNASTSLPATISSDLSLSNDEIHVISGKVVVEAGATLTIDAGTIIKGEQGSGSSASALIVARGGKIIAEGTADNPIIFTSTLDNIALGETAGTNLDETDNQKWGGLIILGRAPISAADGDTESLIEGLPGDEEYGLYGGDDPADNSGILRYVSVRHGGAEIGEGNEINGITLGGVGTGTLIENVEVTANLDDGIEFFGGTVNVTNAIVTWQGDDAIDIDQNYAGTINNFYIGHGGDDTDEALEIDGPESTTYTDGAFTLLNGTCVAYDQLKTFPGDYKSKSIGLTRGICFKGYSTDLKVRCSFDPDADCLEKSDSHTNFVEGRLSFENNMFDGTANLITIYSDDDPGEEDCFNAVATDYNSAAISQMTTDGNTIGACSGGANTSVFDWTLAAQKGWIQ